MKSHKDSKIWAWMCFSLGILTIVFITSGCSHNVPKIDVSVWAGDSAKNGISRAQEGRTIECTDPSFDAYACLTYTDIQKIYSTILQCQQWGPALASKRDYKRMVNNNREVIQNVIQRSSQSRSESRPVD